MNNAANKMKYAAALASGAIAVSLTVGVNAGFATANPERASVSACESRVAEASEGNALSVASSMDSFDGDIANVSMNVMHRSKSSAQASVFNMEYTCTARLEDGKFKVVGVKSGM